MAGPKKEKLTAEQKFAKEFPEFVGEVNSLDVQAMKNRIAGFAKALSESEDCKENDEALQNTKAELKELGAPYREVKKDVAAKTKYLLQQIAAKGG